MAHTIIRRKIGMAKAVVPVSEPFKQVFPVKEELSKPLEIKKKKKAQELWPDKYGSANGKII